MRFPVFFFTILLVFSSLKSNGQKKWSLDDCINYALENNIQIKQQSLGVDLSKFNLRQSQANLFPNLNLNASHGYNWGRTIDRFTNEFATQRVQSDNFYLSSGLYLFNGFQLLNTVKKYQLDLQASKLDVEKMKNDIALAISTAFLNVLYAREMLDVARNQQDITNQQVDRTSKLVEAGTVARGNLLSIQAQAATEEVNVVNARNQLDLAYLALVQLLDLPSAEGFEIQQPSISLPEVVTLLANPEQIYNFALTAQPGIKSAETKVQRSEKDLLIAKGTAFPSLAIQGSYGTGYSGAAPTTDKTYKETIPIGYTASGETVYSEVTMTTSKIKPFDDQISDNENKSLGFYLSVPILNGFQSRTSVARARIAVKNAEYDLQLQKNQLNKDIQQAYADAQAALKKYYASKKSVDALDEAFKYAEQKFNIGLMNPIDYNDAKNKLITAKSELLQGKYEYVFRKTVLDFYQGKPITIQ